MRDFAKTTATEIYVDNQRVAGVLEVANDVHTEQVLGDSPDPKWTFVDARGHFHAHDEKGLIHTVERERERVGCDGACGGQCGGEGSTVTHLLCLICQEEIFPGMIPGPHEVVVGTTSRWTLRVRGFQPPSGMAMVSVRVEADGWPTRFGVAAVGTMHGDEDGLWQGELVGAGPLSRMAKS